MDREVHIWTLFQQWTDMNRGTRRPVWREGQGPPTRLEDACPRKEEKPGGKLSQAANKQAATHNWSGIAVPKHRQRKSGYAGGSALGTSRSNLTKRTGT